MKGEREGGEVHIHTHNTLVSLSLSFIPSHSPLSCKISPFTPAPIPLSHISALTIQFTTMNAGELLANSLSSGKVLCFLVRPVAESRHSASFLSLTLSFRIPHNSNSHPPLFYSQIRLRVKMPLKN